MLVAGTAQTLASLSRVAPGVYVCVWGVYVCVGCVCVFALWEAALRQEWHQRGRPRFKFP